MTYDWESRRDEILELYQRQGKPLHEVMKIMKERYDFGPSVRAYRSRLKRWVVLKYTPRGQSQEDQPSYISSTTVSAALMTPSASAEGITGSRWALAPSAPIAPSSSQRWAPATPSTSNGSPTSATSSIGNLPAYSPSVGIRPSQIPFSGPAMYTQRPQRHYEQHPHRNSSLNPQDLHHQQRKYAQQNGAVQATLLPAGRQQSHTHQQHQTLCIPSSSAPQDHMEPMPALGGYIPSATTTPTATTPAVTTPLPFSSSADNPETTGWLTTNNQSSEPSERHHRAVSGQELSPLEHYIRSHLPGSQGQHFEDFCRTSALYILNGADTSRLLPRNFDNTVHEIAAIAAWNKKDPMDSLTMVLEDARHPGRESLGLRGKLPTWVAVWLSACEKYAQGHSASVEVHLSLLSCNNVDRWRALLPCNGIMGAQGWHGDQQQ